MATRPGTSSHTTTASRPGTTRYTATRNSYSNRRYVAHGTPARGTGYSTQKTAASTRYARSAPVQHLSNSQQRLARVHLQPERVQEIQQALIREGYLHGDANGQWDSQTHDAMQHYQMDHGFPTTGLPEAKSLMKLGLGAHPLPPELDHGTAGVGNPGAAQGDLTSPPPPATSALTPPS
jgi:peptidoglycan hydrolase-like protein with peptidoglycan-binding domain